MRRDQAKYIRALRLQLGNAMRAAQDVVGRLSWGLEQGYRWEAEDVFDAMIAVEDLAKVVRAVDQKLKGMLAQYGGSLSVTERRKLETARKGLDKAHTILKSIEMSELVELEEAWLAGAEEEIRKGHEAYFLRRYNVALKVLRTSWATMFGATQSSRAIQMVLTQKQMKAWNDPMSDVRKAFIEQATRDAKDAGREIVIVSPDGNILISRHPDSEYIARQAAATVERGRQAKRADWSYKARTQAPGQVLRLADASPDEALAVQEVIIEQPGISLREAAASVGVEVVPYPVQPMTPNADQAREHKQDIEIYDAIWSWDLGD